MSREKIIYNKDGIIETVEIETKKVGESVTNWKYLDKESGLSVIFGIEYLPHHRDYQKYRPKFGK